MIYVISIWYWPFCSHFVANSLKSFKRFNVTDCRTNLVVLHKLITPSPILQLYYIYMVHCNISDILFETNDKWFIPFHFISNWTRITWKTVDIFVCFFFGILEQRMWKRVRCLYSFSIIMVFEWRKSIVNGMMPYWWISKWTKRKQKYWHIIMTLYPLF